MNLQSSSSEHDKLLVVIAGPTAVGKTKVAIHIARHFKSELISADSRQIYKELNIGTAKPTEEELAQVKHHFINHISIHDEYDAGKYEEEALKIISDLHQEHNIVILTGGTGLYIKAVLEGLDTFPEISPSIQLKWEKIYAEKGLPHLQEMIRQKDPDYAARVDISNHRRLLRALMVSDESGQPYSSFLDQPKVKRPFAALRIVLTRDRKELYERINQRVDHMMDGGLLDEVKELFHYRNLKSLQTVGYQELFTYLEGECNLSFAVEEIKKDSRRYAKRQMTWFRNQGSFVEWPADELDGLEQFIEQSIEKENRQ